MSRWNPPWMSRALGELVNTGKSRPLSVWRVENDKGLGPYQAVPEGERIYADDPKYPDKQVRDRALFKFVMSGDKFAEHPAISRDSARTIVDWALHPTPHEDFEGREWRDLPDRFQKQYKFGFPTKGAAIEWFGSKRLREFESQGFNLKEVPAGRVVLSRSGRQVLYVPWGQKYKAPPKPKMARYSGKKRRLKA